MSPARFGLALSAWLRPSRPNLRRRCHNFVRTCDLVPHLPGFVFMRRGLAYFVSADHFGCAGFGEGGWLVLIIILQCLTLGRLKLRPSAHETSPVAFPFLALLLVQCSLLYAPFESTLFVSSPHQVCVAVFLLLEMATRYHPISLDEEPSLEKGERRGMNDEPTWAGAGESFASITRNRSPSWIWLVHAVLLSVSGFFFAHSFWTKTAKISDFEYTKKFSTWCTYLDKNLIFRI